MAYRVVAGAVSAETKVQGESRATVDFPRGAVLPDDVPAEQLESFLARGLVELLGEEFGEQGEEREVDLSELDKDQLLSLAEERGVQVDKRWGVDKLVAALEEN